MPERSPNIIKIREPQRAQDVDGVKIGEGIDNEGKYKLVCTTVKPGLPDFCIGFNCPARESGVCDFDLPW